MYVKEKNISHHNVSKLKTVIFGIRLKFVCFNSVSTSFPTLSYREHVLDNNFGLSLIWTRSI
jgi:hypothetical protein